ncbi:hypothetical protein [Bacillus sp. P14.5]|uniref:hypothetical protein n=1 Tax=Bacillus sp. P14.5 TaxID=1983400 RepID=UPI000DE88E0E|nr:hypothetical protein [Bacillus sp. P14.5]
MESSEKPLYHLSNQETIFYKSRLQEYEKQLKKMSRTYLFIENKQYKENVLTLEQKLSEADGKLNRFKENETALIKEKNWQSIEFKL